MSFIREHIVKRFTRDGHWSKVRCRKVKKTPACEICGSTESPELHHKKPFAAAGGNPKLELADGTGEYCQLKNPDGTFVDNLCTLCGKSCHLTFGHRRSFQSYNPTIDEDIVVWHRKIKERP